MLRLTLPAALTAFAALALASSLCAQRIGEGPEPNQTVGTATQLACGQEAFGFLSSANDRDWYRFVLTTPANVVLRSGPSPTGEIGDTVLVLLDAGGAPLQASDDAVARGYYSRVSAPALPAGTYYCSVQAGANAAPGGIGNYLLDLGCHPLAGLPTPPVAHEGPENNDPRTGGTATNVIASVRCDGDLSATGFDGDWDFYRVLVFGDSVLRVTVDATAGHASQPANDPVLYLFDSQSPPNVVFGPVYASDFGAWDQELSVRVAGGIHQIAVRGSELSDPGAYYLDVRATPAARATVHAGGCGGRVLALPTTTFGPGQPQSLERASLGMSYSVEGQNLGSLGYAFHVIGFQATLVDLGPLGAPGCTLEVVFADVLLQLADNAGRASWTILVPEDPSLIGARLESQAAVLDLSNPLGITISNRVTATLGY